MDKGVDKEAYIYGSEAYEPRKSLDCRPLVLIFVTTTVAEKIQISGIEPLARERNEDLFYI